MMHLPSVAFVLVHTLFPNRFAAVLAVSLVGAAAAPSTIRADLVLGPVSSTANSFGELGPGFPISNIFDQSGLSIDYTNLATDFDTYNATHSDLTTHDWVSSFPPSFPGNIDFDLGAVYQINQFALWNDIQPTDDEMRGINDFTIFTDDNAAFSSPTNVGSFTALDEGVGTAASKQVFNLADSVGRFVRIEVTSIHATSPQHVQVGEIAFGVVTAVPEASAALMVPLVLTVGLCCQRLAKRIQRRRPSSRAYLEPR